MYSDFEKAFDKVPNKRLISKLRSYGFDDVIIMWVQDFLRSRKFRRAKSYKTNPGILKKWYISIVLND